MFYKKFIFYSFSIFCLIIHFNIVVAQKPNSFQNNIICLTNGIVLDSLSHKPILAASIEIQEKKDVFTHETITDAKGFFSLKMNCNDKLSIKITALGYTSKTLQIKSYNWNITKTDTFLLTRNIKGLDTIKIAAKKKSYEYIGNKIIYHVTNDPDANYLYSHDILQKIPGVFLNAEDNLTINGSENFLILINGRKSALMSGNLQDILKSFPASNIKDIEIQYNSSAKYASEGVKAVVNFILNRRNINGYNLSLGTDYGLPKTNNQNLSLLWKNNHFSFNGNIINNFKQYPTSENNYELTDFNDNKKVIRNGNGSSFNSNKFSNNELNIELDSLKILSFNFSFNNSNGNSNYYSLTNAFYPDKSIQSSFDNSNNSINGMMNIGYGTDFEINSKRKKGRVITFSYQNIQREDSNLMYFKIIPFKNYIGTYNFNSNSEYFKEKTAQIYFINPFGDHSFQTGLKWIGRDNQSIYFYKVFDSLQNNFQIVPSRTDEFNYLQNVFSAFSNFEFNFKKSSFRIGASIEKVLVDLDFKSNGSILKTNFFNILPNINYSKRFNALNVNISVYQTLERPSLFFLNPFIDASDPFYISYGNPKLLPAINNNIDFGINYYRRRISMNLFFNYNQTRNSIQNYTSIDENQISRSTYGNIGFRSNLNSTLGINMTLFRVLNLNFNYRPSLLTYSALINQKEIFTKGFTHSAFSNFSLKIGRGIRFNGSASYTSNTISLQGNSSSILNTSINLVKDFGKKRNVTVSLNVTNPHAEKRTFYSETIDPTFYLYYESISVIRYYNAKISIRLNKYQGKIIKKKVSIENTDLKTREDK